MQVELAFTSGDDNIAICEAGNFGQFAFEVRKEYNFAINKSVA